MSVCVGDQVVCHGEEGLVCSLDPPIMRLLAFRCYKIFDDSCVVQRRGVEPGITVSDQLRGRVLAYLQSCSVATPTGE